MVRAFGMSVASSSTTAYLPRRQIVEIKNGAAGGLTILCRRLHSKTRRGEREPCPRLRAEKRTSQSLGAGEILLVVLDGGLDAGEIGCEAGDRVLPQGGDVALGGHIEIALARGGDGGAGSVIEFTRGLTTLRAGADGEKPLRRGLSSMQKTARRLRDADSLQDSAFTFIELGRSVAQFTPGFGPRCLRFWIARKWLTAIDLSSPRLVP